MSKKLRRENYNFNIKSIWQHCPKKQLTDYLDREAAQGYTTLTTWMQKHHIQTHRHNLIQALKHTHTHPDTHKLTHLLQVCWCCSISVGLVNKFTHSYAKQKFIITQMKSSWCQQCKCNSSTDRIGKNQTGIAWQEGVKNYYIAFLHILSKPPFMFSISYYNQNITAFIMYQRLIFR